MQIVEGIAIAALLAAGGVMAMQDAWPSKIEVGSLKAGSNGVTMRQVAVVPARVGGAQAGTVACASADGAGRPGACPASVRDGTALQVVAVPGAGMSFAGWTGDCARQGQVCRLTADHELQAEARFVRLSR